MCKQSALSDTDCRRRDAALALTVGERYPVKDRMQRLSPHLAETVAAAREVLVEVAAHREVITYGELSEALDRAVLPRHMGPLLWMLGHDCRARDEPSLASLVVSAHTGEVGTADTGWAAAGRQSCWAHWAGQPSQAS